MRQNFKLILEYDGACYHGWQRQKDVATIQGTLEAALNVMTGQPVTVIGSGRTDAGVHASNQVANFVVDSRLTAQVFRKGLNSLLPDDIVIKACSEVARSFHARYDASSKIYEYVILNQRLPRAIFRQYAWHVRNRLDLAAMRQAVSALKGTHDFSAFQASGSPRSTAVRTVLDVSLVQARRGADYLVFRIEADGFLRCMVRNIVGTLVDVGRGKISPETFSDILKSKNRNNAGVTAPPHGLFLKAVRYR
ncbi:MAG: tRNA pseudouridine(38-40) synthase TruA [Deltaproteobacteria bacterium]|nr:tRNA pseudouridine(38-40) synthase TruA [Deltaproteobacteria bacterium]